MKVRVQYAVEISVEDRLNLAIQFREWPSRSDIKTYLEQEGIGGLEELALEFNQWLVHTPVSFEKKAAEMRRWGVPLRVIRNTIAKAEEG